MSYNYSDSTPAPVSEAKLQETFNAVMARVYLWMTLGLALTAGVSFYVFSNKQLLFALYSNRWLMWGLFIVQIVMVIALVAALNKLSTGAALALFFAYAALLGVTLTSILLVYDIGTITMAFGITAILFVILSIIGLTTKQDLTKWGPILLVGLFGLIIATIVNIFLRSSTLDLIITYLGIIIFMGLIVYDSKSLKQMSYAAATQVSDPSTVVGRISVLGALKLYLDFINLFLFLLRLLGRR